MVSLDGDDVSSLSSDHEASGPPTWAFVVFTVSCSNAISLLRTLDGILRQSSTTFAVTVCDSFHDSFHVEVLVGQ